jgi:hypothetical protein
LIVVDATNMDSRAFKDELTTKTLLDYPQIRVEFVDPEVSRIYMNSARVELEFQSYPRNLRQAISMGRQSLDPIAEFTGLYSGPIDAEQWSDSANTSAQLMHSIQSGRNEDEALKRDCLVECTLVATVHGPVPVQHVLRGAKLIGEGGRVVIAAKDAQLNIVTPPPASSASAPSSAGLSRQELYLVCDHARRLHRELAPHRRGAAAR